MCRGVSEGDPSLPAAVRLCRTEAGNPPEGMKERGAEGMNRNKICLNVKVRVIYILKPFSQPVILSIYLNTTAPGTKLLVNNLRLFLARQGATTDHSLSYGRKEQRSMGEKEPKELVKNFVPGALLCYFKKNEMQCLRFSSPSLRPTLRYASEQALQRGMFGGHPLWQPSRTMGFILKNNCNYSASW